MPNDKRKVWNKIKSERSSTEKTVDFLLGSDLWIDTPNSQAARCAEEKKQIALRNKRRTEYRYKTIKTSRKGKKEYSGIPQIVRENTWNKWNVERQKLPMNPIVRKR